MTDLLEQLKAALADRYTIDREIGRGGMAVVFLAQDLKHERNVAVKVLRPELAASLGVQRFLREISVAARLSHPHILPLHDSGEAEGFLYYVMPYIEGETLRDRMNREGQLPLDDALQITREVAAALSYAHSDDVIHRDIKPENVLLSAGEAVVADFGIARAITEAGGEHLTETGISIGTPAYVSPEQASGDQKLDGRSDVYSLGCVLYEMLAGEPPYTGPTAQAIIAKKLSEAVPRVSVVRERVPSGVEAALNQALAKTPADRFATAQQFSEALDGPQRAAGGSTSNIALKRVLQLRGPELLIVAGLLVVAGMALSMLPRGEEVMGPDESASVATAEDDRPSIAVLPFLDLSETGDREFFSDGVSEELLNLLAGIPEFRVTSRTSAFSFKGQDIDIHTISQKLNVSHVLEGSVRIAGENARISVQLIDAEKDVHLWSQTYDRHLVDIFAIQDEIAAQVAVALKVTLLGKAPTSWRTDPEAYGLYLQGKHVARQVTAENLRRAIELYEGSLSLDPGYVPAWDALASAFINQANTGQRPAPEGYELARGAAQTALELDPGFARSHGRLGWVAMFFDGDLTASAQHYQRALALDPTDVFMLNGAATLAQGLGRLNDAIAIMEHVTAQDPVFPAGHSNLGIKYMYAGHWDAAAASFRTALTLAPDYIGAQFLLGITLLQKGEGEAALLAIQQESYEPFRLIGLALVHHALGNESESDTALGQLIEHHATGWAYNIAYVFAYRGDADAAFEWLELAVDYQDSGLADVSVQPFFANLFSDPRWPVFLEKMGKSKEQLARIEFNVSLPG